MDVTQLAEFLPSMHKALSLIISTIKTGPGCKHLPCQQLGGGERIGVQGYPQVYSTLEVSLRCMRPLHEKKGSKGREDKKKVELKYKSLRSYGK